MLHSSLYMRNRAPYVSPVGDPANLVDLVRRFGGVLSPVVFDPACELFTAHGLPGAAPIRRSVGNVVVAVGDPLSPPEAHDRLLATLAERFGTVVVAGASAELAARERALGWAVIEFGEQITIDPRRARPRGRRGHELNRKLSHARRATVEIGEYVDGAGRDAVLERALDRVARAWLDSRRGLQIFVAHIDLFSPRALRRWFYATWDGRVVGVQSLVQLDARGGYLLEHLLTTGDVPAGTAELLVAAALDALGREGCSFVSFGISTAAALGHMSGLGPRSVWLGRWFFDHAQKSFRLDSISRFRKKFGEVTVEPSYLLFHPARVTPRALFGLVRAFNASLAWSLRR